MNNLIGNLTAALDKILRKLGIRNYFNTVSRFNIKEIVPRIAGVYQYLFRVKNGKILSISNRNISDIQFKVINQQLRRYDGWHSIRRFGTIVERGLFSQFFMLPYHIVTAEVIILEDSCKLLKYLKRDKKKRIVIQVWHATGAYKKFGLALAKEGISGIDTPEEIGIAHTYDYFIDPGLKFRENYYEAFSKGCEVIEGAMNPRVDLLFDEEYVESKKRHIYAIYPEFKDKKVLLYTPTFRGYSWETKTLKNGKVVRVPKAGGRKNTDAFMDFDKVLDALGDEWIVVLKKHPAMREAKYVSPSKRNRHRFYDVTVNVNSLMLIADLMVCDYSSTFFEMAMLEKPIVFLAKDIDSYLDERGFFYNFYDFVPGEICKDEETLCIAIKEVISSDNPGKRSKEFVKEYFGEVNHNNAERFADFIAGYVNRNGVKVTKQRECNPFFRVALNRKGEELEKWARESRNRFEERMKKIHAKNDGEV